MSSRREESDLTIAQRFGLIQEIETAIFLLVDGLIALNRLSAANDFSHLPLQLLAQGFERLLKCSVCLAHFNSHGELPPRRELKTHDIRQLLAAILRHAHEAGYAAARPAAQEDIDFLESDRLFLKLVDVMSQFSAGGRYHDLDSFLDPEAAERRESPRDGFSQVENMILDRHPEWFERLGGDEFSGFYAVLSADLTACLQRAARALTRMYVWDLLGALGKQVSSNMHVFLMLKDDQLATVPRRWFE